MDDEGFFNNHIFSSMEDDKKTRNNSCLPWKKIKKELSSDAVALSGGFFYPKLAYILITMFTRIGNGVIGKRGWGYLYFDLSAASVSISPTSLIPGSISRFILCLMLTTILSPAETCIELSSKRYW